MVMISGRAQVFKIFIAMSTRQDMFKMLFIWQLDSKAKQKICCGTGNGAKKIG